MECPYYYEWLKMTIFARGAAELIGLVSFDTKGGVGLGIYLFISMLHKAH